MKAISFKANIVLRYAPKGNETISWEDVKKLVESGNITLDNFAVNYYGKEFEPTLSLSEVEEPKKEGVSHAEWQKLEESLAPIDRVELQAHGYPKVEINGEERTSIYVKRTNTIYYCKDHNE